MMEVIKLTRDTFNAIPKKDKLLPGGFERDGEIWTCYSHHYRAHLLIKTKHDGPFVTYQRWIIERI